MTILDAQDWTFPVAIAYGPGRLKEIGAMCRKNGISNPLIVTDRNSRDLPFLETLAKFLKGDGLSSGLYADFSPNPCDHEVAAGLARFDTGDHDGIIGIGGGSAMDGAKAIGLSVVDDSDLWAFDYAKPAPDLGRNPAFPPLITIPTTAGTGAETESTAMITDTAQDMKWCIWHAGYKPAVALLDPELSLSLPENLTAWTGCDALVHAIEAYSVPGFHPLCDGMALEALKLIGSYLRRAVANGEDLEARGGMLVGSCLAGISFLKGLGLVHSISHAVGAKYDTHHGLTNAVLLPAVLGFNAPAITDKTAPMAQALGLSDTSFEGLHGFVCDLLDDLHIPKTLSDLGLPPDCAASLAEKSALDMACETNPRPAAAAEIQSIIEKALQSGR